jgi:single-strand DNA-binding protein
MSNLRLPEQNQVFLIGRLTKDPELRYTPKGIANCRFRIAVSRRYKDTVSGEWKDDAAFINIVTWRQAAESCGKRLRKGSPVSVEGRLRSYEYEDKNSGGAKRSMIEVEARRVQVLEKAEGAPSGDVPAKDGVPSADAVPEDVSEDEEVPF